MSPDFPYPYRVRWPPPEEIASVCVDLYKRREDVRRLVDASRHMAEGTSFDHPGFLARGVKESSAVKRLLCGLGVLHIRSGIPELRQRAQEEAAIAVKRWDEGDAEGDLRKAWEHAIERCRFLCACKAAGHWVEKGPFTRAVVIEVMKGTSTWVGDINYGYIRKLLLAESVE